MSTPPLAELLAELLPRCTFPQPGSSVDAAVSGGADSLALLVLAVAAGLEVGAIHVDHGLRPGSAAEADAVAVAATGLGARFTGVRVTVEPGPNLEARARAARYAALPLGVLTGHTLDDQAETVLLALLRGSGLDGLAGMRSGPQPNRPLLALRRSETSAVCAAAGLTPLADPSNDDPRFRRNRIRHELLPLLDDIAARDVAPVLARQAALLRDEADLLDELAAAVDPTDARALTLAPVALARRSVRRWLAELLGGYPPDAAAIDRVLRVAAGEALACEIAGGVTVRRSSQRLIAVLGAASAGGDPLR